MRTRPFGSVIVGIFIISLPALSRADERHVIIPPPAPHLPGGHVVVSALADPLQQLAGQYTTPKAVAEFLHREFKFMRDQELFSMEEYWQTPLEFLSHKAGDCEDYALMARELLTRNGIEAHVFSLFGDEGYAHTVCVFMDERGRYNVINQDKLRYYRAPTLEALASQMYSAWTFGGITEQAGIRGRLVEEITNPHPVPALASLNAMPASGLNH